MNSCKTCNLQTNNPLFCSRSCSATNSNKLKPKRRIEPQNQCTTCSKRLSRRGKSRKTNTCLSCISVAGLLKMSKRTKKEVAERSSKYKAVHKYQEIRNHARRLFSHLNLLRTKCDKCGYPHHVELAHIKGIASFSDETLVEEINSVDNIKFLCPNCHWELDNLH